MDGWMDGWTSNEWVSEWWMNQLRGMNCWIHFARKRTITLLLPSSFGALRHWRHHDVVQMIDNLDNETADFQISLAYWRLGSLSRACRTLGISQWWFVGMFLIPHATHTERTHQGGSRQTSVFRTVMRWLASNNVRRSRCFGHTSSSNRKLYACVT